MRKTPRNRKRAPLLPIPVEGAFDRVAVDCLGPSPESYIQVLGTLLSSLII